MCVDDNMRGYGVYSQRGYMVGDVVGRVWTGASVVVAGTPRGLG